MRASWDLQPEERASRPIGVRPPRVVAIGGGTGLPQVLVGLARAAGDGDAAPRVDVTAVVATSDDGGSSGELSRCCGIPATGDVRNCLVALSASLDPLAELFQHRFDGAGGLTGHTVGNLLLAALAERLGDFGAAIDTASQLLATCGRVLPATDAPVALVATMEDGREIRGECAIVAARGRVRRIALDRAAPASPAALDAIGDADLVVLGPGSLYSSVIAPLLADGMADALRRCRGTRVLVVNLLTEPGETDRYTAADHVRAVQQHAGPVVDVALLNDRPVLASPCPEAARPVRADAAAVAALGATPFAADLVEAGEPPRHDPGKLARALLRFAGARGSRAPAAGRGVTP